MMTWRLSTEDKALMLLALTFGADYELSYADALVRCTEESDMKARAESIENARKMQRLRKRLLSSL